MSLNDDWKAGKIQENFYYVKSPWNYEIDIRYVHNGVDEYEQIFAPVPSYKKMQQLKAKLKHSNNKILADKEVYDSALRNSMCLRAENEKVKDLLKECIPYINDCIDVQMSVGHYPELEYDLLARINAAIGESEE